MGYDRFWLILFLGINALDMLTTWAGIHLGLAEKNPLMAWALQHGLLWMELVKVALVALMLALILRLIRSFRLHWPIWLAATLPVVFTVFTNLGLISR